MKIICSGRLAGAEMARTETQKMGSIPLHTLDADVDYAVATSRTTYGTIGIKVWIYKGKYGEQIEPQHVRRRPQRRGGGPAGGGRGRGAGKGRARAKVQSETKLDDSAKPVSEEKPKAVSSGPAETSGDSGAAENKSDQ